MASSNTKDTKFKKVGPKNKNIEIKNEKFLVCIAFSNQENSEEINSLENFTYFYRKTKQGQYIVLVNKDNIQKLEDNGFNVESLNISKDIIPKEDTANLYSPGTENFERISSILSKFEELGFIEKESYVYHKVGNEKGSILRFNKRDATGKKPIAFIKRLRALLNAYEFEDGKKIILNWAHHYSSKSNTSEEAKD